MSLVSEFLQKVGLIRNETQYHGNTKERVADTFETLFNLDIWFKKLDPQNPNANKIYQADGTLVDLPEVPATPFIFTPTDDFTLSEIKTALEADGWKWNDSRILIELGTQNLICDVDVATPTLVTIERNGTGSISFTGTNLSFGTEGVSILTNSQISMALLKIISGTTKMIRISNKT